MVSVLFVIQNFEVKGYDDCAGIVEVVRPVMASGMVTRARELFFQRPYVALEEAIEARLSQIKALVGETPLVVYGAGLHTQSLMPKLERLGLNVVALADRDEGLWGQRRHGLEIVPPHAIEHHASEVLISSRAFEKAIAADLKQKLSVTTRLHTLYEQVLDLTTWQAEMGQAVVAAAREMQPDILFYCPAHPDESIPPHYFNEAKASSPGTRIVTLWWDYDDSAPDTGYLRFERENLGYSDLVLENTNQSRLKAMMAGQPPYQNHPHPERVLFHPTVFDPALFHPYSLPKRYEIALFGSSAGERRRWIDLMASHFGSRFHHLGGVYLGDKPMPIADYAGAVAQTEIFVNTQTYPFRKQCKGKVREALACGSFLVEEDNPETRAYLAGNEEVLYFRTETELLNGLEGALADPQRTRQRARKAAQWYRERYHPRAWLQGILSRLGIDQHDRVREAR